MKKQNVDSRGIPLRQVIIGWVLTVMVAVLAAGVIAFLTGNGTIDEDNMKLAMVLTNLLASLIGCLIAVMLSKRSILVVAGVVGGGYLLLLLCANILLIDGPMESVLWSVTMIAAGVVAAILVGLRGSHTKRYVNPRVR